MDYERLIAPAAAAMRPSGIRKFFDLAAEMKDCISLGVGEPDFKTPWRIRDAGIQTLQKGRTTYTANAGMKELRQEIANSSGQKRGNAIKRLEVVEAFIRSVKPDRYFREGAA